MMNLIVIIRRDSNALLASAAPGSTRSPHPAEKDAAPAWLTSIRGDRLPLKKRATIGRDRDSDIILPEASVSRRHALLAEVSRGRWWLCDLNSRAGTWHNDLRVTAPVHLKNGDRLRFARGVFVFHQPAA